MAEGLAKELGIAFRDPNKLIPKVAQHIMREEETDRRSDVIHPSEASHGDWCPRATYYRIAGAPAAAVPRKLHFELALETGSDAHKKWQRWFWEMGVLSGNFRCLWCGLVWWDTSPHVCPRCEHGYDLLEYAEVPVEAPEYLLNGNADGDVGGRLIEIKTIGTGTVRIEAPGMMKRFTYTHVDSEGKEHTGVDWYALWKDIKRPFPSHIRQGSIYCFCAEREHMTYIYDPKFVTAWPKEFEIRFQKYLIEDVLDKCLLVKKGLDAQRPPKRPMELDVKHAKCKSCEYQKVCYGLA